MLRVVLSDLRQRRFPTVTRDRVSVSRACEDGGWNLFRRATFAAVGRAPSGVVNGHTDQERTLGACDQRVGSANRGRCCRLFNPLGNRRGHFLDGRDDYLRIAYPVRE